MSVEFSRNGETRFAAIANWWRENRQDAPFLFEDEVAELIVRLAVRPTLGVSYRSKSGSTFRRVLLPQSEQHVYFEAIDDRVIIHSIWGARRKHGPPL